MSRLLCSVDLLVVVSASLRRKNAKAKTFWTKVATDATSKRHNMAKDFKVKVATSCLHSKPKELFQKHHISSQNPRNCMLKETFPFKRFVLHQNYFQTSSNSENFTKLLKIACRPLVSKLYHNTIVIKARYLLSSSVKAPKSAKTQLKHFATRCHH